MVLKGYVVHRNKKTGKTYRHQIERTVSKRTVKICNGFLMNFDGTAVFTARFCTFISWLISPICHLFDRLARWTRINGNLVFRRDDRLLFEGDKISSSLKNKDFHTRTFLTFSG